jgi:hypothetical protein
LQDVGEHARVALAQAVAIVRVPVGAFAGNLGRDLQDVLREWSPPRIGIAKVPADIADRVLSNDIHAHGQALLFVVLENWLCVKGLVVTIGISLRLRIA